MYSRILIVVSPGIQTRAAVVEGVALAKVHDAEVLFFTVLPRYVVPVADTPFVGLPSPAEFQRVATANAERLMASAMTLAGKAGVRSRSAVGAGVDDAECIVDAARKRRCDLIVAASTGRNAVMRLLSGSVIPGLITHAAIPVLVVRQPRPAAKAGHLSVVPVRPRTARRRAAAAPARRPIAA